MPTACVFMSKHVLNDRPSRGLAILWTSFEPRLDLIGTSFESSVHAAYGTILILLPASLSKWLQQRLGRRTVHRRYWYCIVR